MVMGAPSWRIETRLAQGKLESPASSRLRSVETPTQRTDVFLCRAYYLPGRLRLRILSLQGTVGENSSKIGAVGRLVKSGMGP